MFRRLIDNLGLVVLALLCGFIAWALVSVNQDPFVDRTLTARVIRVGESERTDMAFSSALPQTVSVGLHGPRSSLAALEQSGLQVAIDYRALAPGLNVVPLTPSISAAPVQLVSVQPVTATVHVEPLVRHTLPVAVSIVGSPAVGFRAGSAQVTPQQVVVTGTQDVISRLAAVNATVSVDGARIAVEQVARLYARDAAGNTLGQLQLSSDIGNVRVAMEQLSNYRDLPVVVRWRGQPADGYAVTSITVDPQAITVFGPVEAIQGLKGFVETQDVNITGAKSDIIERLGLIMPPGVSLVSDAQQARVQIRVEPVLGSRTLKRKPVIIGATQGLSATVSPDSISLLLNGPLSRLTALTEDDVRVLVDVTGLTSGVYQLTPRVILPDGVAVQSLVPATVQVEMAVQRKKP